MNIRCPLIAGGIIVTVGLLGWAGAGSNAEEPLLGPALPESISPPPAAFGVTGVASCATASCHGGPKASNYAASSFSHTLWASNDKHSQAYEVLFDKRSTKMARMLQLKQPAHLDHRCISCHTIQGPHAETISQNLLSDGVGCESCHGSAERWQSIHYLPEWRSFSKAERKHSFGYEDLSNPLARVTKCVDCHIGSEGREVDHDMIAAGHPRLMFEFAAYQRLQPIHWNTRGKAESQPDFNTRSWAVGQALSLAAACQQLARRAEAETRWSELSEFDCYACHCTLTGEEKTGPSMKLGLLGQPQWGTWHMTASSDLAAIQSLSEHASQAFLRHGDLAALATQSRAVASTMEEVARELNRTATAPSAAAQAFHKALNDESIVVCSNWDGAAQVFLGLTALLNDRPSAEVNLSDHRVDRLRGMLEFAPSADSPTSYSGDDFQRVLRELLKDWNPR